MEYITQYSIGALVGAIVGFLIGYLWKMKSGGYLPIVEKVEPVLGQFGVLMVTVNPSGSTRLSFKDKVSGTPGPSLAVQSVELCGPVVYKSPPPPAKPLPIQLPIAPVSSSVNASTTYLETIVDLSLSAGSTYVVRLSAVGEDSNGTPLTQKYDYVVVTSP